MKPSCLNSIDYVHVIPSLQVGGAEKMMIKISEMESEKHIVLYFKDGPLKKELSSKNINSMKLNGPFHLIALLKSELKGRIIIGWLYKPCIYLALAKLILRDIKIFFNHRNTLNYENTKKTSRKLTLILLKFITPIANGVIYNSFKGQSTYHALDIKSSNENVIQNGFNINDLKLKTLKDNNFAEQLNLNRDVTVYLVSARNSPEKRINEIILSFMNAFRKDEKVALIICGTGTKKLKEKFEDKRIYLMGQVDNIHDYYQVSDYLVLFSTTEGFPNVVGEAMFWGLPCIVSDVGDCEMLVNSSGWVCKVSSLVDLQDKFQISNTISSDEYYQRSKKASELIANKYDMNNVYKKFLNFVNN